MKVCHWTMFNQSGMNRVAETLVAGEKALGLDSHLCNIQENPLKAFESMGDADIHVSHTHFPDQFRKMITKPFKLVWISHGTPENVFNSSVVDGTKGGYGAGDAWMLMQHWMKVADARVTFWPRHQAILQSMADKRTTVHLVPLGIDKTFWKPVPSLGKFTGSPSLFTCENCHPIKWPLDLFIAWPWVYPKLKGNPCLHCIYLPTNSHRWFFPLVNANGASYASHISSAVWPNETMRNAFVSNDYSIGLVQKGDFNRVSLEANACGTKTISYEGNPYSDFWVPEGDQRIIADRLVKILNGEVEPRKKDPIPDAADTAVAMKAIYESL